MNGVGACCSIASSAFWSNVDGRHQHCLIVGLLWSMLFFLGMDLMYCTVCPSFILSEIDDFTWLLLSNCPPLECSNLIGTGLAVGRKIKLPPFARLLPSPFLRVYSVYRTVGQGVP